TPSRLAPEAINEGTLAIAALDQQPPARPDFGPAVTATAYAAPNARIETTQAAQPIAAPGLRPAIAASAPRAADIDPGAILTAAIAPQADIESFAELFEGPILPMDGKPDAATANALTAISAREGELFA